MNIQNTPWDAEEHDRIISMLAWVVVAVIVLYSSVYFYRHVTSEPTQPIENLLGNALAMAESDGDEAIGDEPFGDPFPSESDGSEPGSAGTMLEPSSQENPSTSTGGQTGPGPVTSAGSTAPPEPGEPAVTRAPATSFAPVNPPRRAAERPAPQPVQRASLDHGEPAPLPRPATRTSGVTGSSTSKVTLKIGRFRDAGAAVKVGFDLGIPGYSFMPVRDPSNGLFTLHFGEFTSWQDAVAVMDRIKSQMPDIEVDPWPLPPRGPSSHRTARRPEGVRPGHAQPVVPPRPSQARPPAIQARRTAPAPSPREVRAAAPTRGAGSFVIQVASFKTRNYAQKLIDDLARDGLSTRLDQFSSRGGETWYRVMVGAYGSEEDARIVADRIETTHRTGRTLILRR